MFVHEQLVTELLYQAGIKQTVRNIQPITNKGITNLLSLITVQDGTRFILRQYQWLWEERDLNRLQKEQHVHALLYRVGVPVPAILAHSERPGQSAVLMDYIPGEVLGDISPCLSDDERRRPWQSCSQMLRRAHTISYPAGTYGVIVGNHIQPFAEHNSWEDEAPSWGHSQVHMIMDHFHQLSKKKPDLVTLHQELQRALAASLPFLNRTTPTLLHNDTHPWNVLVRPEGKHWQCAAWLDWEYAWVGDPNWDLVRMDLFRRQPIGPTPDAFWDGYGRFPAQPERSVYEMHILLWMTDQYLMGDRHLLPTYEAAMTYVDRFGEAVQRIHRWLT